MVFKVLSLASSRAQWEQEGNRWMQPHSVSLCCRNVFCAVKKKRNIYTSKDNKLLLKRNRLILLESTLKTRDQERYIAINTLCLKVKRRTLLYVLSVCLRLAFSFIQTKNMGDDMN